MGSVYSSYLMIKFILSLDDKKTHNNLELHEPLKTTEILSVCTYIEFYDYYNSCLIPSIQVCSNEMTFVLQNLPATSQGVQIADFKVRLSFLGH